MVYTYAGLLDGRLPAGYDDPIVAGAVVVEAHGDDVVGAREEIREETGRDAEAAADGGIRLPRAQHHAVPGVHGLSRDAVLRGVVVH